MYYIAVLPPEEIRKEIREFKNSIQEAFGSKHALRSPAHITLQMPFHFEENEEQLLVSSLSKLACDEIAYDCALKDFGHFGNRVIFVDVVSNAALKATRLRLQDHLRANFGFSEKKLPERFHPHITIANKDLSSDKFKPCWEEFANQVYERTFTVNALHLLKHGGDHWDVYRDFPFNLH